MRKNQRKPRSRPRPRPFMIDIEDFETVEDIEMADWMFGSSGAFKFEKDK